MYIGWYVSSASAVQVQNQATQRTWSLFTTCEFWCPKTACFGGTFLHPPQWWRDFCTACKSLTWVASVGYTTNEHIQNRGCSGMRLFVLFGSAWTRLDMTYVWKRNVLSGLPPTLAITECFEQCRHPCAKQWDRLRNPSAIPSEHRLPSTDRQLNLNDLCNVAVKNYGSKLKVLRISGVLPSSLFLFTLRGLPSSWNSRGFGHCNWDMA